LLAGASSYRHQNEKKADLVGWCLYYQQFEQTYRISADGEDNGGEDNEDNGGEDNGGAGISSAGISSAGISSAGISSAGISSAGISSAGISSAGTGSSAPSRSTLTVVGSAARTTTSYDADSLRQARARSQKESVNSKSANTRRNYLREIKQSISPTSEWRAPARRSRQLRAGLPAHQRQHPAAHRLHDEHAERPETVLAVGARAVQQREGGPKPQYLPSVGAYYTVISGLRCARGRRGDDATVAVMVMVWCWCGGVVVWWCGGVVVWWCGVVVWWCGDAYCAPFIAILVVW
jgi:hypothetical protein